MEPYTIVKETDFKKVGNFDTYLDQIRKEMNVINTLEFNSNFQRILDFAKALSSELRLKILYYVHSIKKTCFCELEQVFDVKQSTLNYHLRFLKRANFIRTHKEGKLIIIELNSDFIELLPDHLKYLFTR